MKTLKVQNIIVFLLICTYFQIGCGDKPMFVPCKNAYAFSSVTNLQNPRETYHIGDTIYIYSNLNHLLFDNLTQKLIDYSKHKSISGQLSLGMLDSINNSILIRPQDFNIITDTGQYTINNNGYVMVSYAKLLTHTSLSIKLVPLQKGNYILGSNDLYCNGSKEGVNDCSGAGFSNYLDVNGMSRNELIWLNTQIPGAANDTYFWDRSFCFRVVE